MRTAPEQLSSTGHGRSHLLDAAFAFAVRVASAGLMFVLQVFLARFMSMDDYGGYVTAWTWLAMLGTFMTMGFAESAVRFVPRYRARGRHGSATAYWRFGLRMVLLASGLLAAFAVVAATAGGLLDSRAGLIVNIDYAFGQQAEPIIGNLVQLFGPEHGIRGDVPAGDAVSDAVGLRTGVPVTSIRATRRGSAAICFTTFASSEVNSRPRSLAAIPIRVIMQHAKDVLIRSVGEKASPFPRLSNGASVMNRSPLRT